MSARSRHPLRETHASLRVSRLGGKAGAQSAPAPAMRPRTHLVDVVHETTGHDVAAARPVACLGLQVCQQLPVAATDDHHLRKAARVAAVRHTCRWINSTGPEQAETQSPLQQPQPRAPVLSPAACCPAGPPLPTACPCPHHHQPAGWLACRAAGPAGNAVTAGTPAVLASRRSTA